ncbi:MAG: DUF3159 domain-containing protein [Actinomycetota bacterium]|jgi:uncharacterized membrane protein|nr:DUF3159 domain-containing protein [Actinomycetota bacterium]
MTMTHRRYSARDLLTDRRVLLDTVAPPVVFVVANATGGLAVAAVVSVGMSLLLVAVRVARRQRLLYAASGLGGVALAVGVAVWAGEAEAYFLPGIVSNAVLGAVSVVSVLVRRPAIALTSAAIYRWPLGWYWHDKVRPAYSEITWVWAAVYLAKAGVQYLLVVRGDVGWLAVARVVLGWPLFAVLLVATYAYVNRRLAALAGPTVDEYRRASAAGSPASAAGT